MRNIKQQESHVKATAAIRLSEERHFSGPLPPPEDLERYDKVIPGAAERIISMAEEEMKHRHVNEDIMTKNVIRTTYLSMSFAFLSVLIMSGLVFYSLYKGYSTVAGSIAVGSIATVAGVFLFKSKRKHKEE